MIKNSWYKLWLGYGKHKWWGKWGDGKSNPDLKTYIELLIKYNNQQKEILEDTKEWLLTNGNQSR